MPIVPNFTGRLLLKLNHAPGPMLDFLGAQAFRVLCVAARLGVFEALGGLIVIMEQVVGKVFGSNAEALTRLQARYVPRLY